MHLSSTRKTAEQIQIPSDDDSEPVAHVGLSTMSEPEATAHIYMQYRRAKRTWRKFMGKPVRKFRRRIKFYKGPKGKGKGKGFGHKGTGIFWTHDDTLVYLKGKGKAH